MPALDDAQPPATECRGHRHLYGKVGVLEEETNAKHGQRAAVLMGALCWLAISLAVVAAFAYAVFVILG